MVFVVEVSFCPPYQNKKTKGITIKMTTPIIEPIASVSNDEFLSAISLLYNTVTRYSIKAYRSLVPQGKSGQLGRLMNRVLTRSAVSIPHKDLNLTMSV